MLHQIDSKIYLTWCDIVHRAKVGSLHFMTSGNWNTQRMSRVQALKHFFSFLSWKHLFNATFVLYLPHTYFNNMSFRALILDPSYLCKLWISGTRSQLHQGVTLICFQISCNGFYIITKKTAYSRCAQEKSTIIPLQIVYDLMCSWIVLR